MIYFVFDTMLFQVKKHLENFVKNCQFCLGIILSSCVYSLVYIQYLYTFLLFLSEVLYFIFIMFVYQVSLLFYGTVILLTSVSIIWTKSWSLIAILCILSVFTVASSFSCYYLESLRRAAVIWGFLNCDVNKRCKNKVLVFWGGGL